MNAPEPRGISAATVAAAREVQRRRDAERAELERLRVENARLRARLNVVANCRATSFCAHCRGIARGAP